MNKYFFVIARYQNEKQDLYKKYIEPKNKAYCLKHGFEYVCYDNSIELELVRGNPTWWKFSVLQQWIKEGRLKEGDIFTHLDADMVIVDDSVPYQTFKSFTYSIDNGNTHCMGNFSLTLGDWSKKLVDDIMCEEFYLSNKDSQHWVDFREQAAWYSLAGILPHSWVSFFDMPHYGFHSKQNAIYDLREILNNVEVRGPQWNTTLLMEEAEDEISQSLQKYNIVFSRAEDTIIRHFAGGQPWRMDYLGK